MINLETKETRPFSAYCNGTLQCSPDWCIGPDPKAKVSDPFQTTIMAARADGSRYVRLPGPSTSAPSLNRFALAHDPPGRDIVVDLPSATSASVGSSDMGSIAMFGDMSDPGTLESWGDVDGPDLWVLNLKAIP
jgi:hypothetical protein